MTTVPRTYAEQVEANTIAFKDIFNDVSKDRDALRNWKFDATRHLRYWCDDLENISDLTWEQYEKYFEVAEFLGDRDAMTVNRMQRDFEKVKLKAIGL